MLDFVQLKTGLPLSVDRESTKKTNRATDKNDPFCPRIIHLPVYLANRLLM